MLSEIRSCLPPAHPWRQQLYWFDTVDSTNTRAKAMALEGAPHGTVLIADRQTGGRGRMGRSFHSPGALGIYMSVILRPACSAAQLMHLTCATAVACCDAVESETGLRPGIKWTNDLVYGKQKLGGILTELVHSPSGLCAIIGIGINCCHTPQDFPEQLRCIASSLAMCSGKSICRPSLIAALLRELADMDRRLLPERAAILDRYRADCITLGQPISILCADSVRHAFAQDIDDDGCLLVSFLDGHTEVVSSGEVSIRGMYGYIS